MVLLEEVGQGLLVVPVQRALAVMVELAFYLVSMEYRIIGAAAAVVGCKVLLRLEMAAMVVGVAARRGQVERRVLAGLV
jgi:hypothetical protein